MKTKTTISAMTADNIFKITDYRNYSLIEVTASEGKEAVAMSFPWANTIPFKDVTVQQAITQCQENTKKTLVAHLESREKNKAPVQKLGAFLRREISYMFSMGVLKRE